MENRKSRRTGCKGIEERRSLLDNFWHYHRTLDFIGITKDQKPVISISYDLKGSIFRKKMDTNMNDRC
jgi:hypothetical protein